MSTFVKKQIPVTFKSKTDSTQFAHKAIYNPSLERLVAGLHLVTSSDIKPLCTFFDQTHLKVGDASFQSINPCNVNWVLFSKGVLLTGKKAPAMEC